jgi:uncharacterized membrane protein (DUF485 family)
MIQRFIGCFLGAVVSFVILWITKPGVDGGDPNPGYLTAVFIGAIVSFLWPWVIGFVLVRRAKDRRDDEIQREVERQLADKQ